MQYSYSRWISPILLLIDLYERTCISILRRNKMKSQFSGYKREWKWFDDRSGRWCNYSVSNHKSIDDAYNQGLPTVRFVFFQFLLEILHHDVAVCVKNTFDNFYFFNIKTINTFFLFRFTAGRRKYSINFHQLIQCNEESGNRRPIMATYTDNLTTTKPPQGKRNENFVTFIMHILLVSLLSLI